MSAAWAAVLIAGVASFALKLTGYLVPARWIQHPRVLAITTLLPAALLSALVVVQTIGNGRHYSIDARLPALGLAAIALRFKAPFIVAVVIAAASAAAIRALGWMD